jgi:selenocysteine lyase/cysteine desulfurase
MLVKYKEIPQRNIVYPSADIQTPFGKKHILYADYIASGRPSPVIENFITKHIYPVYSNTHSNAANGITMKNEIERVKNIIKAHYGIDDSYEILFKGSGSTAAINHLAECLEYKKYKHVHIFISTYEHYSNNLPWLELSKRHPHINLHIIPLTRTHEIDLKWFRARTREICTTAAAAATAAKKTLIITSITHASNVTGYFPPHDKIRHILGKSCKNIDKYFFTDAATSAPYVKIDGTLYDALFISGHKFIGGVETPGLLIAKTCLFQKDSPMNPGGSCVKNTHRNVVEYANDIEVRESAGSPNVVGIIKLGQCFLLKERYQDVITNNEHCLEYVVSSAAEYFRNKYPATFRTIRAGGAGGARTRALPVFSFCLTNIHYNLIVKLLNDLYGIQSRGGIMCSGLFADYVEEVAGFRGFCRISFHWLMTKRDIEYILGALDHIMGDGEKYKSQYTYNEKENLWEGK